MLIAALRKAHAMLGAERGLPTLDAAPTSPYDRNILRLAFLAPDIQQAILDDASRAISTWKHSSMSSCR